MTVVIEDVNVRVSMCVRVRIAVTCCEVCACVIPVGTRRYTPPPTTRSEKDSDAHRAYRRRGFMLPSV